MRPVSGRWLAVLCVLLAGSNAAADPPSEQGETLVEGGDDSSTRHRLVCGSQFCLWHVSSYLGGCSEEDCNSHDLVVSDRKGRSLGGSTNFSRAASVRFLSPRQAEIITFVDLITHNPGGQPWDAGINATLMLRNVVDISPDGSSVKAGTPTWASPERHKRLEKLVAASEGAENPKLAEPVPDALLAKAKAACGSEDPPGPLHHECRKGTCVLVLGGDQENSIIPVCVLEVKGQNPRLLPIGKLVEEADRFTPFPARYCFVRSNGGIRGGPGDEQCISRAQPSRMAFVETKGLHLESGHHYPVRKVDSVAAGREIAPTVHAYTAAQVRWGLDAWKGEKDLSLAWQAMRVGDDLQLHVEVDDDVLVPAGKGPAVHTDHLELDFWDPRSELLEKRDRHLKLGVLLADEGKVQARLWKRGEKGKDQDADEEYAASGTWARTERGYSVDISVPLEPLRKALGARRSFLFDLTASDADDKGRQKTLLGDRGSLRFWDEDPPTIEDYLSTINE
jgi:hypothetical protein